MSHISCVQTLVNARGKNRRTVFFLPKLLLSFTSTRPEACLDLRLKSGALEPTGIAIVLFCYSSVKTVWVYSERLAVCQRSSFTGSSVSSNRVGRQDAEGVCAARKARVPCRRQIRRRAPTRRRLQNHSGQRQGTWCR